MGVEFCNVELVGMGTARNVLNGKRYRSLQPEPGDPIVDVHVR